MIETTIRILDIEVDQWLLYFQKNEIPKVGDWVQKRKIFEMFPFQKNKQLKLQSDLAKTELAIEEKRNGTKIEVTVSNFEQTAKILEELGYQPKAYQENKRIQYLTKDLEFNIDTWPLINPFLEIKGKPEKIKTFLKKVPLSTTKQTTQTIENIYKEQYGIEINLIKN